jgi:hypothetical protein
LEAESQGFAGASGLILRLLWSLLSRAFSGEVDPGSRQENASKQKLEPAPIQSERKGL